MNENIIEMKYSDEWQIASKYHSIKSFKFTFQVYFWSKLQKSDNFRSKFKCWKGLTESLWRFKPEYLAMISMMEGKSARKWCAQVLKPSCNYLDKMFKVQFKDNRGEWLARRLISLKIAINFGVQHVSSIAINYLTFQVAADFLIQNRSVFLRAHEDSSIARRYRLKTTYVVQNYGGSCKSLTPFGW